MSLPNVDPLAAVKALCLLLLKGRSEDPVEVGGLGAGWPAPEVVVFSQGGGKRPRRVRDDTHTSTSSVPLFLARLGCQFSLDDIAGRFGKGLASAQLGSYFHWRGGRLRG